MERANAKTNLDWFHHYGAVSRGRRRWLLGLHSLLAQAPNDLSTCDANGNRAPRRYCSLRRTAPATYCPRLKNPCAFRVGGTVAEVKVQVGDRVKAGDVLARLETLTFDNAVRDATFQLEQARLALQKAQRKAASGSDLSAALSNIESARLGLVSARGNYSATLLNDITVELQKAKFWNDYYQDLLGRRLGETARKTGQRRSPGSIRRSRGARGSRPMPITCAFS